jgi:hypothetical protein
MLFLSHQGTFRLVHSHLHQLTPPQEDLSNYWTPQLYVHMKDGTFKPVPAAGDPSDINGGMTVYYLQRPSNDTLTAFPAGFRMLAGDSSKRSGGSDLATQGISFACLGANQPETNFIPPYPCPYGLRAQVFFPACWDGVNLDSADHKSHMSYPNSNNYNNGPCPASHPVHTISLFYEVLYDTNQFADQWNGTQHPFVFANGDATGYGFHGDFVSGWDVDVLQNAIDTCTDDSGQVEECAAVTLFTHDEQTACRIPVTVAEKVDGTLTKLPGCNDVTYGPARASPPAGCIDNTTFGPAPGIFVDFTTSKHWSYLGCGTDSVSDRAFQSAYMASDNLTVEACVDFCIAKGWSYAGLEYAQECFCGNALNPTYAPKDGVMGGCNMKCRGSEDETCGGSNAMSVYGKCGGGECENVVVGAKAKREIEGVKVEGQTWDRRGGMLGSRIFRG